MYPDLHNVTVLGGEPVIDQIDEDWYKTEFTPRIQKRGAEIIEWRGLSRLLPQLRLVWIICVTGLWAVKARLSAWASSLMAANGVAKGIYYSFPCICEFGSYQIVKELEVNEYGQVMMKKTEQELLEEKAAVDHLLPAETAESRENLKTSTDGQTQFDNVSTRLPLTTKLTASAN